MRRVLRDISDARRAAKPWLPADDRDVTSGRVQWETYAYADGHFPACATHGAMHRIDPVEHIYRCAECGVGCRVERDGPSRRPSLFAMARTRAALDARDVFTGTDLQVMAESWTDLPGATWGGQVVRDGLRGAYLPEVGQDMHGVIDARSPGRPAGLVLDRHLDVWVRRIE